MRNIGWIDGLFFLCFSFSCSVFFLFFTDVIAVCTKCAGFSDYCVDKWTEILYIVYMYTYVHTMCTICTDICIIMHATCSVIFHVFIANCTGHRIPEYNLPATAFTLSPIWCVSQQEILYYRIFSGNAWAALDLVDLQIVLSKVPDKWQT